MIQKLYKKHRELISYLIVGVLTTFISLASYYLVTLTFLNPNDEVELQIANVISWILSVTFAYFTNRIYVFKSKNKKILNECIKFYGSRLFTLFLDMVFMFLLVIQFNFNDKISKLIVQIILIISNYILSKFMIFKK